MVMTTIAISVSGVSISMLYNTAIAQQAMRLSETTQSQARLLEAVAAKGGLIGIEAAPHTTLTAAHPAHSLESFMEHFEYVKGLVGIEHVTFGPDTVYGDHVGLHDVYAANLSIDAASATGDSQTPGHEKVAYVKGLENPTEGSHNIVRWLVKRGYSDQEIALVIGGNALRLLRQVWV